MAEDEKQIWSYKILNHNTNIVNTKPIHKAFNISTQFDFQAGYCDFADIRSQFIQCVIIFDNA